MNPTQPQYQNPAQYEPAPAPPIAPATLGAPTQVIRPPEANGTSFIPDAGTKEILDRTYPEMTNALVNLAIKKYSENSDYAAYFVREEFKAIAEERTQSIPKKETVPKPVEAGFTSW